MEECIHTKGKSCVQKMKHLQDIAKLHNLTIIEQSQPSCDFEPWIVVQNCKGQIVTIKYSWDDKKIATEEMPGIMMAPLPQKPGEKISYEIFY